MAVSFKNNGNSKGILAEFLVGLAISAFAYFCGFQKGKIKSRT